jgi:DNA-binding NarL/FixJ family response regulator
MPADPRAASGTVSTIVIVDDHDLARAGLRSMLTGAAGLEIVGEATNGREAVALCRRVRPALVLMDVRMPEMDGLAATRAIKAAHPETSVLMVTLQESPDYRLEALTAGAAGYILKDATHGELIGAIRRVLAGESLLNPELATKLLLQLALQAPAAADPLAARLTPRERDVLDLLAQGRTNRQIGVSLIISPGTVKVHVERIIAKLGVSDRTQAAVRAIGLGLLRTPPGGP